MKSSSEGCEKGNDQQNLFAHIKPATVQGQIVRIFLCSLAKEKKDVANHILNLTDSARNIYIICNSTTTPDPEILRSLAGRTLIRFSERPLPDACLVGFDYGAIQIDESFSLRLDKNQVMDLTKWFNYIFWRESQYEILDASNLNGLPCAEAPYDPIYPGVSNHVMIYDNRDKVGLKAEKFERAVISDQWFISMLKDVDVHDMILDGIEQLHRGIDRGRSYTGRKKKRSTLNIVFQKDSCTLFGGLGKGCFKISCCSPEQIPILKNEFGCPGEYALVSSSHVGELIDGSEIFIENKWQKIVDEERISPMSEAYILPKLIEKKDVEDVEFILPPLPKWAKKVHFSYKVKAPSLPSNAKEHDLGSQWVTYHGAMGSIIADQTKTAKLLIETNIIAAGMLERLELLSQYPWATPDMEHERKRRDLLLILNELNQKFKEKNRKDREEARQKDEMKQREEHKRKNDNRKKELDSVISKIEGLEKKSGRSKDDDKKINELKEKAANLEKAMNNQFVYTPPENLKLSKDAKKMGTESAFFKGEIMELPEAPKKRLPKSGALFTSGGITYLAVASWDQVPAALEEAKEYGAIPVSF